MMNPPIMVLVDGTSLIPNTGNQTQKIPPIISVKDNKVSSAAGKFLDPIEYNIRPITTSNPCKIDKDEFLNVIKKLTSLKINTKKETTTQNNPAIATVVNVGVSFFHLSETEKIEKPSAVKSPNTKPNKVPALLLFRAIKIMPTAAITIEMNVVDEIFSLRKIKPIIAVIKGIAASIKSETATEV